MISFLAVLGINTAQNGFEDALGFTPKLSALVKLAQLLVLQQAVTEYRGGRAVSPNKILAEMQDRFMVYGSESPFEWMLHLRAYGSTVRNFTTAVGYINWSDDRQRLSYKSLDLTMNSLRWFVRDQVEEATKQLHNLLLLPAVEYSTRAKMMPPLDLASLKDDPTNSLAGFSFLQEKRNHQILHGKERFLLHQLRDSPELRKRFFRDPKQAIWEKSAVQHYIKVTYMFLRRLLLLVHLTGGQPARGTELLTLRWRNSACSELRNIFIENGLVAFVTSYHKNYSMNSTTKIIFRYLPPPVGELLVYYVWLVIPFLEQLHTLSPVPSLGNLGSLLWPATINPANKTTKLPECSKANQPAAQETPWPSSKLGQAISEQFLRFLRTAATVLTWRHAAIAISRQHLPEGSQFKRDYGPEGGSTAMDLQAAHTSRIAGITYARDCQESPFSTASLRAEFRTLSCNWHTCLGFGVTLPPRDGVPRPPSSSGAVSSDQVAGQKRSYEDACSGRTFPESGSALPSGWEF
jgi:hypothetical protein